MSEGEVQILFVGGMFDDAQRAEVQRYTTGPMQSAADALQWGYIHGLETLADSSLTIYSAPFVGSYPRRYSRIWIHGRELEHGTTGQNRIVGFLNLAIVKHLWRTVALSRAVGRWLSLHPGRSIIMGYALTLPTSVPLWLAKRRSQSVTSLAIIPDLPEFMDASRQQRPFRRWAKSIESALLRKMLARLDGMVVLTKYMAERLPPVPHVVIEGMVEGSVSCRQDAEVRMRYGLSETERFFLYSGGLNHKYGVSRLCEAFRELHDADVRLVLCGAGDAESEIRRHAQEDGRILFLGQLPRAEVVALQASALALVNPRANDEEFTRHSFPSKTLEYMNSGRPVLCYKLHGIPDDYDPYLIYVEGHDIAGLAHAMQEILELPAEQLADVGSAGRDFVVERKNPQAQVRKIMTAFFPDQRWA